jgi:hypothetical protein
MDGFLLTNEGTCVHWKQGGHPDDSGTPEGDSEDSDPDDSADPGADDLVLLTGGRLLRRISLDLRGLLPTLAELDQVEADPTALETMRDAWLTDPRFEQRLVEIFAEQWHTQVDEFLVTYREYQALASSPGIEYPFERSVGEEPLRLMAHLAATDRPFSEILTADFTLANELLASIWDLEFAEEGEGWRKARYRDGRPAAGVLATNGLWWRYHTTVSNYNRGRVAALVRLLVCEDYLSRPVSLEEASIAEGEAVEDALRANPYCMGCHASIDPIASALFGFYSLNEYSIFEIDRYHPEREPLGALLLDTAPEWFGTPVSDLAGLGRAIADDPRFPTCVVKRMSQALWRRAPDLDDFSQIEALRQSFLASGLQLKALVRAITDTPIYRAGATVEGTESTVRLLGAPRLASMVEDLTGFTWEYQGFDLMRSDTYGYRILAGGVDGIYVSQPQATPSLTWLLVTQRLAEGASSVVIEGFGSGNNSLFGAVDDSHSPGDAAFETSLENLVQRLTGEKATEEHLVLLRSLWTEAAGPDPESFNGASRGWRCVLMALLQDPEVLSY